MPTAIPDNHLQQAMEALRQGRAADAVRACNKALKRSPGLSDALHLKGLALQALGESGQAVAAIEEAIRRQPGQGAFHGNLGRIRAAGRQYEAAVRALAEAVRLDPRAARDREDLGTALCCIERFEEGAQAYRRALELDPGNAALMLKLARTLVGLGWYPEALDLATRAATRDPRAQGRAEAVAGHVYLDRREWQPAADAFGRALAAEPSRLEAALGRARALLQLADGDAARTEAERAMALAPDDLDAVLMLARVEKEFGDTATAAALFERAAARDPRDLRARFERANLLPVAYETEAEMAAWRRDWQRRMSELATKLDLGAQERLNAALRALKTAGNFRLPYQGQNDRELAGIYGGVVHRIAVARYPEYAEPPRRPRRDRPRIGFVSEFLRRHSIWKTHSAWITALGGEFEKYVYYTGIEFDPDFTGAVREAADVFVHETAMTNLVPMVAGHDLDVLIYLDHGMSMELQPMAGLWLAPVQANGLGHPETSGLPTMTHALSSELMEPADGENHYSERLVRLPHTASCYHLDRIRQDLARVSAPEREAGRINFLCSQNLQKYLPRHDHVFADIAADLPTARFNFIARAGEGRAVFERRLARAFQARGLKAETFCRLHPRLDVEGYLRLNLACDVFLDGISWSGNNTTHEAIACGLPVVTWPGALMRARHSAALLQRLELTETVADSAEGYVALAVQLGRDAGQRAYLKAEMAARIGRLFDDPAPIRGLEKFLRQVTG